MAPRVKLGDLPPAEKERMMAFLVANQVEFKPDISGNFTAVLKLGQAKAEPKVEPKVEKMEGCQGRSDIASSAPVEEKVLEVAAELKKRFPSFTALLPNIAQHPKTMLKAELIGFVEEVYTARYNQDLLQVQRHAEAEATGGRKKKKLPTELTTFPQSVLTAAGKRYGLPQMVGQVCWSLVKSVDQFRAEHEGIEIFARFLEESYDAIDLLFYLEMRWAARQMTMPRGTWTSWRSRPQAFSPQERFLGNNVDSTSTSASKSSPSRPQLTLKQASAAVREGIDPEAPEALKAQILNRLKAEGGLLDWDHFLFICTQEYRRARRAARGLAVAPPGSASARQAQRFARLLRQAWRLSVPEAFERFSRDGSHLLSAENFKQVATGELGLKAARAEELWRLLDGEKRGFIEQEEWNLLDVQEAPSEEPVFPPGWDSKLSVSESEAVQGEAKQVAARLAAYLEEHGEEVDENEVLRWALRSVLQRREAPPQASLEPMSLEVHGGDEQKLEATVREHLASATGKLVEKALGAFTPEMKAVREALIEEFMPITDALMEAVVIGDLTAWQTRLNAFEQEKTFKELSEEFQRLLTDEASTEGLVSLVCNVAGAEGLQAMCRARGLKLMEERGLPLPSFEDPEVQDRSLPIDDAF